MVAKVFLSADNRLHKLTNKHIQSLFHDIGHSFPLSADKLEQMRNAVHNNNKQIFVVADESTLFGIQCLNIVVGSKETPHVSYLFDCQFLLCVPNST